MTAVVRTYYSSSLQAGVQTPNLTGSFRPKAELCKGKFSAREQALNVEASQKRRIVHSDCRNFLLFGVHFVQFSEVISHEI
jgi:hypothetical protein